MFTTKRATTCFLTFRSWRRVIIVLFLSILTIFFLHRNPATVSDVLTDASIPFKSITSGLNSVHEHDSGAQTETYSIKPIAYIFPQFHPIPENDVFWGANFTEWTNVKKVTHNVHGQETIRPTDEVGYYNLLDKKTRIRYREYAQSIGLYGFVYHHYWFSRPVMDRVLLGLLEPGGEPNMPFMLSWANEPWSGHWDGLNHGHNLISQSYGSVPEWREHFDWLLPFFKHPNYIRNNGRLQFLVYNPPNAGSVGKRMFEAFRKWAFEEGLGRLDIIETQIGHDNPMERGITDGMNQFGCRSGGAHDGTKWSSIRRRHNIYHRGVAVSWDNSPRHATDGKASVNLFAHCKLWKNIVQEQLRHVMIDSNPRGEENFFFINAFNEWGEGNILEPSKQWGYCYGDALRSALDHAKALPWKDDTISSGEKMLGELEEKHMEHVDVCVIIRTMRSVPQFTYTDPVTLSEMIESLKNQENKRWRAIVVPTHLKLKLGTIKNHILESYDPRVVFKTPPKSIRKKEAHDTGGWAAVDWVIANLETISPECAVASQLLVSSADVTYEPTAFNILADQELETDITGLRFETPVSIDITEYSELPWDARCTRLRDGSSKTCIPASKSLPADVLDPGALLMNMEKFIAGRYKFMDRGTNITKDFLDDGWTWGTPPTSTCNMIHSFTPKNCNKVGRFWIDVPEVQKDGVEYWSGCYSLATFVHMYDNNLTRWDMVSWKLDPTCLRLKEEPYKRINIWDPIMGERPKRKQDMESAAEDKPIIPDVADVKVYPQENGESGGGDELAVVVAENGEAIGGQTGNIKPNKNEDSSEKEGISADQPREDSIINPGQEGTNSPVGAGDVGVPPADGEQMQGQGSDEGSGEKAAEEKIAAAPSNEFEEQQLEEEAGEPAKGATEKLVEKLVNSEDKANGKGDVKGEGEGERGTSGGDPLVKENVDEEKQIEEEFELGNVGSNE